MEVKMNRKKLVLVMLLVGFFTVSVFAENVHLAVEMTGVTINGGSVYVFVFSNEQDYKKDISFTSFIVESTNSKLTHELDLPEGEYLISAYQDSNGNGKLDTGFLGIPKEPVGISNYNGHGTPGGFKKHKVPVNSRMTAITINLGMIKL